MNLFPNTLVEYIAQSGFHVDLCYDVVVSIWDECHGGGALVVKFESEV